MKQDTIHGKSLFQTKIEADQRSELIRWHRRNPNREAQSVEIERFPKNGQFYDWKLIISYKEKDHGTHH